MNAQAWFNGPTGFGRSGNASPSTLPLGRIEVYSRERLAWHRSREIAADAFFRFENWPPCWDRADGYSISPEIRTDEQRKQDNAEILITYWHAFDALIDAVLLKHHEKTDTEWPCEICHGDKSITVGRGENVWPETCPTCKGIGHA